MDWDEGATANFDVARISTDLVPTADRAALLSDELAARLTAGKARVHGPEGTVPDLNWLNVDLGAGAVVADIRLGGLDVARDDRLARTGDDGDCSLFIALGDGIRFEQNDRRTLMSQGDGVFVAHGRAVRSWYTDAHMALVKLPREGLSSCVPVERAGGLHLAGDDEAMVLLRAYLTTLMIRVKAGHPPSALARRQVGELVTAAVLTRLGQDEDTSPAARSAARLDRMMRFLTAHHARPGLSMRDVAAAANISERSGYLAFAAAGLDFSEQLASVRLQRARELLDASGPRGPRIVDVAHAVGFADLSHFNRRFREHYGCTPREARGRRRPPAD